MSVQLVGILNMTPDSFSDGGLFVKPMLALGQAQKLFVDGASILDVGAESTNPKKSEEPLTSEQELGRLLPVLQVLIPAHPGKISVDSYHPETIEALAERFGADFIANDVTGMNNSAVREVVAKYGLICYISHLPAKFGTDIQGAHSGAKLDDENVVLSELLQRRQELIELGLDAKKIVLDPGVGFGKTMRLNWRLLEFAKLVHASHPEIEVMLGPSRKRYLATDPQTGKLLNGWDAQKDKDKIMEYRMSKQANQEAAELVIRSGANIIRTHEPAFYKFLG